ncbi:MAG: CBS domain-containing protein [Bacteroidales bacterium]|jgi:predicted transcriptional regulator|nr:CBS domain-containing protein [Bacteroidales bacterium]MCK9497893.1 CBS domain-containing protein [Bacteroidales bacterium]MDY0313893.1 CBS domain-containing protein [Bacteroidales bacterium]NLB86852.1 CBS domain-containing protein [Bacteroidales bacterium]
MLAQNLISETIPVLKTSNTGSEAIAWMETYRISHLPIVNNEEFLGLISDSDIYNNNDLDSALGTHNLSLIRPYIYENQHIYEIVDLFAKLKLTIVPVLDVNKKYLGSITLHNMVNEFAKMISVDKAGGIIILEMTIHDYSLSEISQIVESNNAKILSLFVNTQEASTGISITIKLDVTDMASVIQTFERYDYKIKASFLSEDILKVFYQDRLDSFLNYLDI